MMKGWIVRKCPPESLPHPPNPTCKPWCSRIELISSAFLVVLDYVEEIFQTFLSASIGDLKRAVAKLKELTLPMNLMLQRESKTDAVKKKLTEVRGSWKMSPLPHLVRKHLFNCFTCFGEKVWHGRQVAACCIGTSTRPLLLSPHPATCRRNCGVVVCK